MSYKEGIIPSKNQIPFDVAELTREVEQLSHQVRVLHFVLYKIGSDIYEDNWEKLYEKHKELADL